MADRDRDPDDVELTMHQAAKEAGVTRRTLSRWTGDAHPRLPSHRHGAWHSAPRFVWRSDLDAFLAAHRGHRGEDG